MDVRNADIDPTVEHEGTCLTYFMVPKESMRGETLGSYLEYVSEFELAAGARLEPHRHDSHEYYYILAGRAMMQIEGEQRELSRGDLVHIPRDAVHSIWPLDAGEGFRALAFAVSFQPPGAEPVHVALPT